MTDKLGAVNDCYIENFCTSAMLNCYESRRKRLTVMKSCNRAG